MMKKLPLTIKEPLTKLPLTNKGRMEGHNQHFEKTHFKLRLSSKIATFYCKIPPS